MKKRFGFSLMEMMIVLVIVSVVMAAAAPMVNRKMVESASEESPWVWTNIGRNIAYRRKYIKLRLPIFGKFFMNTGIFIS